MMKIAICDDEQKDRKRLYDIITQTIGINLGETDIESFVSGEELLASGFNPDILFLDIIMNEMDGIQTGDKIKENNPNAIIIYITNLKEKISIAVNRIHAFGFLEKPILRENVFTLLTDAVNYFKKNVKKDTVTFLSGNNSIVELEPSDIYYFEYSQRRVKIMTSRENYLCKDKISEIARKMEPYGFAMCHQSFVVNLYEVERIVPPDLIMKNNDRVHLAQKRQAAIRKMIRQIAQKSTERKR